VSVDFSLT